MAIKYIKDGKETSFNINACEVQVLDMKDNYKKKDLESIISNLGEGEQIHIGTTEPEGHGIWFDDSHLSEVQENGVLKEAKDYTSKIEMSLLKDIQNLDDMKINKKVKYYPSAEVNKGANPNNILDGSFLIAHELNPLPNSFCYYEQFFYGEVSEKANRIQYVSSYNGENRHFIRRYFEGKWEVKELATVDDTGWMDLPLADGCTCNRRLKYRKLNNVVYLQGNIATINSTTRTIGTLPSGFRPSNIRYYASCVIVNAINVIQINSEGIISSFNDGSMFLDKSCDLDIISFPID